MDLLREFSQMGVSEANEGRHAKYFMKNKPVSESWRECNS